MGQMDARIFRTAFHLLSGWTFDSPPCQSRILIRHLLQSRILICHMLRRWSFAGATCQTDASNPCSDYLSWKPVVICAIQPVKHQESSGDSRNYFGFQLPPGDKLGVVGAQPLHHVAIAIVLLGLN